MPTLSLYGVDIYLQAIGSVIAVFLEGAKEDVEMRFNSFYNHEATNGELEWETDTRAMFWINPSKGKAWDKLRHAMTEAAVVEILQERCLDEETPAIIEEATTIAKARIDQIEWVTWHQSAVPRDLNPLSFGRVSAERETGDITDTIVENLTGINLIAPIITDKKTEEIQLATTLNSIQ